ncbi:MAG: membrane dipeptidase [Saprospiraceae bacterium]|nr:membrane dipeptidase [Saprospiraceae bacterium]
MVVSLWSILDLTFVDGGVTKTNKNNETIINSVLKRKGWDPESAEAKQWVDLFRKQNPRIYADVEKVADHIDHIVSLAGIDHVGLGSDFDGVGDSLPNGLKDVADYPNLIASLLHRGYSENDIEKICYKNLFRVWQQVTEYGK